MTSPVQALRACPGWPCGAFSLTVNITGYPQVGTAAPPPLLGIQPKVSIFKAKTILKKTLSKLHLTTSETFYQQMALKAFSKSTAQRHSLLLDVYTQTLIGLLFYIIYDMMIDFIYNRNETKSI